MVDTRPAPLFIGDDPALDFLNSLSAPAGTEIEWLADGHDLLAWLEQARLLPAEIAARLRVDESPRVLDEAAARARALREWFRGFVREHAGAPIRVVAARELLPLNELLREDEAYRQIKPADAPDPDCGDRDVHLRWTRLRRWRTPTSVLLPLAEAMGDLVCDKDFSLVRNCEGPGCRMWFFDISKAHSRRWCSMALCGNRAKATAHRARAKRARLSRSPPS